MSSLPNRPLQPPKSPASSQAPLDEQDPLKDAPPETREDVAGSPQSHSSDSAPLIPQRPLMRPVARPAMPPKAVEPEPSAPPAPAAPAVDETPEPSFADGSRHQPIPAPSEPMQYRAIGLLRGRYTASEEQFTRGTMITTDGTEIQTVLLGRVMSLVRNHLDLEQDHLWVVYPRTREKEEDLHAQIVGVWEPEKLNKAEDGDESSEDEEPSIVYQPSSEVDDDYFSIRGEVVFHAPEENSLVVKIEQAPRKKDGNRSKCFKLKLEGTLTGKVVGYFWDLQVRRRGDGLVIERGTPIGMIPPKKKPKSSFSRGGDRPRRDFASPRPSNRAGGASRPPTGAPSAPTPTRKDPLPKPVKKRDTNATEA